VKFVRANTWPDFKFTWKKNAGSSFLQHGKVILVAFAWQCSTRSIQVEESQKKSDAPGSRGRDEKSIRSAIITMNSLLNWIPSAPDFSNQVIFHFGFTNCYCIKGYKMVCRRTL